MSAANRMATASIVSIVPQPGPGLSGCFICFKCSVLSEALSAARWKGIFARMKPRNPYFRITVNAGTTKIRNTGADLESKYSIEETGSKETT